MSGSEVLLDKALQTFGVKGLVSAHRVGSDVVPHLGETETVPVEVRDELGDVARSLLDVLSSLVLFPLLVIVRVDIENGRRLLRPVHVQLLLSQTVVGLVLISVDNLLDYPIRGVVAI